MNALEQLSAELSLVWPEFIKRKENKFKRLAPEYGSETWENRFINRDPSQATQDQTKASHELQTHALELTCKDNGIPLLREEGDGYDWVYLYENEKIPIEQKTRTMLFNGSTYQKNNVKKYGVIINSWTGGRSAAVSGKKTDVHILIGAAVDGNKIPLSFGAIVSIDETKSQWKAGASQNSGFGNLTISNHKKGSYCMYGGFHQTPTSAYALLQEVH